MGWEGNPPCFPSPGFEAVGHVRNISNKPRTPEHQNDSTKPQAVPLLAYPNSRKPKEHQKIYGNLLFRCWAFLNSATTSGRMCYCDPRVTVRHCRLAATSRRQETAPCCHQGVELPHATVPYGTSAVLVQYASSPVPCGRANRFGRLFDSGRLQAIVGLQLASGAGAVRPRGCWCDIPKAQAADWRQTGHYCAVAVATPCQSGCPPHLQSIVIVVVAALRPVVYQPHLGSPLNHSRVIPS